MIIILKAKQVRRNLLTCLRETTLMWHTAELSNTSRRILTYKDDVDEWVQALVTRFKPQASTATAELLRERYTMKNAKRLRELREYTQKIIKLIKSAKMNSMFNQLNVVYNGIDVKLRRDFRRSTNIITLDDYLQKLNGFKDIWWNLIKKKNKDIFDWKNQGFVNKGYYRPYNNGWNCFGSFFFNKGLYTPFNRYNSSYNESYNRLTYQKYSHQYVSQEQRDQSFWNSSNSFHDSRAEKFLVTSPQFLNQKAIMSLLIKVRINVNADKKNKIDKDKKRHQRLDTRPQWQYQRGYQRAYYVDEENEHFEKGPKEPKAEEYYEEKYHEKRYHEEDFREYDFWDYYQSYDEFEERHAGSSKSSTRSESSETEHNAEAEFAHFVNASLTLECKRCNRQFYFNNKLHRHFRDCKITEKSKHDQIIANVMTALASMMNSAYKREDFHDFAFRTHQYASMKGILTLSSSSHDFCMNSGILMFLIDREFLSKHVSNVLICQLSSSIKIRKIRIKMHDSTEYVVLNLFLSEKIMKEPKITHLTIEFHLMNDLKANVLVEMNVMRLEKMIMNFEKKIITISICENVKISITIQKKGVPINRTVRAVTQITVSVEKIMTVSVKVRGVAPPTDRDYSFYSKKDWLLGSKGGFFAHVTDSEVKAVQVKNTSVKPFVISKNFKIEHLKDYSKEECFLTTSKDRHLAILSVKRLDLKKTLKGINAEKSNSNVMKIVLSNDITVYENQKTIKKLIAIAEKTSQIWCLIFKMMKLSSEK